MNSLEERYKYYLISVVFDEVKILINDINPVIKALNIFIDDIILTPKDEDIVYRINNLEVYVDKDIQEFRINDNQNYLCSVIYLDMDNVQKQFKENKKSYFDKLEENNINIPQELYGTLFICSLKAVEYFINTEDIKYVDDFIKSIGREK